jgi:hypothetical protein
VSAKASYVADANGVFHVEHCPARAPAVPHVQTRNHAPERPVASHKRRDPVVLLAFLGITAAVLLALFGKKKSDAEEASGGWVAGWPDPGDILEGLGWGSGSSAPSSGGVVEIVDCRTYYGKAWNWWDPVAYPCAPGTESA